MEEPCTPARGSTRSISILALAHTFARLEVLWERYKRFSKEEFEQRRRDGWDQEP